jgi:hypothetical protein
MVVNKFDSILSRVMAFRSVEVQQPLLDTVVPPNSNTVPRVLGWVDQSNSRSHTLKMGRARETLEVPGYVMDQKAAWWHIADSSRGQRPVGPQRGESVRVVRMFRVATIRWSGIVPAGA